MSKYNYPSIKTRRTLLAAEKAGLIKPAQMNDQIDEIVDQWRLIVEQADAANHAADMREYAKKYLAVFPACEKCGGTKTHRPDCEDEGFG